MAREFLYIVTETAYGTPKTSPTLGTDAIYIRLDGSNGFTGIGAPKHYEIMHGGGLATPAIIGADMIDVPANLTTKLYGSQAVFLSNWFGQLINSAQTSPFTTTEPAGDLVSCSVYHAVTTSTGSIKRRWYPGAKVANWTIDCTRDSQVASLSLALIAQKFNGNSYDSTSDPNSTIFPAPAESAYPTDPFTFTTLAGNFTLGTSRTQFSSLKMTGANVIDARFFESRWLQVCRCLGRRTTIETTLYYKPSPDDLANYQQVTALTAFAKFDNGTNTLKVDYGTKAVMTNLDRQTPVDKVYELPITITNVYDPSLASGAGADIIITAT